MKFSNKRILIMILVIIFIIILSIISIKIYKNHNENVELNNQSNIIEFRMSMKEKTAVFPYQEKYYDTENSFKIIITNINLGNKDYELKYEKNYENKKIELYINEKELLIEEIKAFTLQNVHIVEDYLFITSGWNDKYSTLFVDSTGKIIKKIDGIYSYKNGVITVFKSLELENNNHLIESYKFSLKGDTSEYDEIKEEINCEDYLNGFVLTKEELNKFINNYCSMNKIKTMMQ